MECAPWRAHWQGLTWGGARRADQIAPPPWWPSGARAAPVAALSAAMAPAPVAAGALAPAVLALGRPAGSGRRPAGAVVAEALGAAAVPASAAVAPAVALAVARALARRSRTRARRAPRRACRPKEALEPAEETPGAARRRGVRVRALLVPRALFKLRRLVARIAGLAPVRVVAGFAPLVAGFASLAAGCALRVLAAVGAERRVSSRPRFPLRCGTRTATPSSRPGVRLRRAGESGSLRFSSTDGAGAGAAGAAGPRLLPRRRGGCGRRLCFDLGRLCGRRAHGLLARERVLVLALRRDDLDGGGLVVALCRACCGGRGARGALSAEEARSARAAEASGRWSRRWPRAPVCRQPGRMMRRTDLYLSLCFCFV